MASRQVVLALAEGEKQSLGDSGCMCHTLVTVSVEPAHIHLLHTTAMKFTVFLGF